MCKGKCVKIIEWLNKKDGIRIKDHLRIGCITTVLMGAVSSIVVGVIVFVLNWHFTQKIEKINNTTYIERGVAVVDRNNKGIKGAYVELVFDKETLKSDTTNEDGYCSFVYPINKKEDMERRVTIIMKLYTLEEKHYIPNKETRVDTFKINR